MNNAFRETAQKTCSRKTRDPSRPETYKEVLLIVVSTSELQREDQLFIPSQRTDCKYSRYIRVLRITYHMIYMKINKQTSVLN